MIRSDVVTGVMSFAEMENMMYKIEGEDLYLIGTSEHSMIGRFIDTITPEEEMPLCLTSYSPCFRKEVGAHGIEERGVYRIHQFEKQEMVVVCKPEDSPHWFEELWKNTVDFFRSMEIPVRTLECCSGDLADLKVKSLDVEAWNPRQQKYFEVGSCSNLGDAQARRLGLSIGYTFAIVIVTVGQLTVEKVPTLIALSAGAILGGIMGSLNGLLITKLKLQPFIATLGTMSVYRGLAYVFTGGWPVFGIPDTYRKTFTTKLFWDIPVSILVLFAIAILTHIVLSKTRFGNYLYAVGGNEEASKLSGVDVDKTKIISYAICGACVVFAGMIMLANLGTGEPASGQGYELDAIAAAAVGGTRMTGGKGSILGTVLGALLLAALKIGMIVIGVQTFYQFIVTGIIIIIAAYFEFIQDSIVAKLSKKS